MPTSSTSPARSVTSSITASPGDLLLDQTSNDTQAVVVESEAVPAHAPANSNPASREQPLHRRIFIEAADAADPAAPYWCIFCGEEIESEALHVHHRDGNHDNNDIDNLGATHGDCHAHHHRTGLEEFDRPPAASRLRIAAGSLDDIEALRKSVANQKRSLAAHQLLDATAEKLIDGQFEHLRLMENAARLQLKHAVRAHPLADWIKETTGISETGIGRLLAAIGDPTYNSAEDRPRRGPAELWAYCGYAPGQKRKRGQKANWNAEAKMRAYVVADSCIKTRQSPYRAVYDAARVNWEERDTSDGHKHNHALRLVAKAILKDIFLQSTMIAPPKAPPTEGSS